MAMKNFIKNKKWAFLLLAYVFGLFSFFAKPQISAAALEKCNTGGDIAAIAEVDAVEAISGDVKVSSRIFELFFGKENKGERPKLCVGGSVFGLLINEDGVTVTAANGSRSLVTGDRIVAVNGKQVSSAEEVEAAVGESGGKNIELEIIRAGERMCIRMIPKLVDGEYKLGVSLRSRTAGIGTVTFIDPETLAFGGLGHGVGADGGYVSIKSGSVNDVVLGGCKRGEPGKAGELSGVLKKSSHGSIISNNECGVFGVLDELPSYASEPIPIAYKNEVKEGAAEIISTVKGGKRQTFKIEIYDIDTTSTGSKSFKIKVTDPTLISMTGGIVRGMSGSPIIQDGKLVGAVTHVMVANPCEGYGIFIENMLNSAQSQVQPKAA